MHGRRIGFCLVLMVLGTALNLRGQTAKSKLDLAGVDSGEKQRQSTADHTNRHRFGIGSKKARKVKRPD